MKRATVFAVLLCTLFVLSVWASGPEDRQPTDPKSIVSPINPQAQPVPIEDLLYTKAVGSPAWSPDGKEIVFQTNVTGLRNLWKVSSSGGWPIQLTHSEDRQGGAVWSPDGKWILYTQDKGGNEYYDIYRIPGDGGKPENLTNTPNISEGSMLFSPDGRTMAIFYKHRESPIRDIALMDWSTRKIRNLTNEKEKNYNWSAAAWSADGKYIYATRTEAGENESSVYRVDVATGERENLTPHQGEITNDVSDVSPDGKTLLITSKQKRGRDNVALLDIATKKLTWITDTGWEASAREFSADGRSAAYVLNEDGRMSVLLYDLASRKAQKIEMPEGLTSPAGNPHAFTRTGDRLLLTHQGAQHPDDFWIYYVATGKRKQLTYSALASIKADTLPKSQLVRYKTFDGKIISAYLWMPYNLKRDGTNPAIVRPHGGPTGQMMDYFNREATALASRGYVCIAPNVRGSTGYGQEFQRANYKDLGGGDLQDEVYATKFLIDTGYVNPKKIGITGGSYGGYMTMMAIGKTPDVWAAGVEQFGIINWLSMLEHEDPSLQEYEKSLLGDPVKDREVYENASPLKYIRNTKAPLLVLQGENDIRVPKEEAEQVVDILKKEGKIVDVTYYPHEGHGFAKRENQIDALQKTVAWFDKYLKGSQEPVSPSH